MCLGRNVAYFEVYKVVPTILRAFNVRNPHYRTLRVDADMLSRFVWLKVLKANGR